MYWDEQYLANQTLFYLHQEKLICVFVEGVARGGEVSPLESMGDVPILVSWKDIPLLRISGAVPAVLPLHILQRDFVNYPHYLVILEITSPLALIERLRGKGENVSH